MKSKIIDITLLGLLACLALIIVMPNINNSIWYDEACTADFSQMSFSGLFKTLSIGNNLPAYYIFMKAWTGIFGISEAALRWPSVLFYLLSICCVYFFAKRLFTGRGPALASALLYLLLQINTVNAVSAKPYSMLAFLCILSHMLFYALFVSENKKRYTTAAYLIVNIIGSFTHIWFFFAVLSQAVYCLLLHRARIKQFFILTSCSFILFLVLWTPVLFLQLHSQSNDWMKSAGYEIEATFFHFMARRPYTALLFAIFCMLAGIIARKISRKKLDLEALSGTFIFIFSVLFVSLLAPAIISLFKPIYIIDRGPIIAAAFFAMLLGGCLCVISYKPVFYTGLALISTFIYIESYSTRSVYYANDRTLAKLTMNKAVDADNIAFYDELKRPMKYYFKLQNFNGKAKFIDLPDIMSRYANKQWEKSGEQNRKAVFLEYYSALCNGKTLLFVFRDSETSDKTFQSVLGQLNTDFKAITGFSCGGITMIKYDLSKKLN